MCAQFLHLPVLLMAFCLIAQIGSVDYCDIKSCKNPAEHVMCLYPKDGPGAACNGLNFKNDSLDKWKQNKILHAHNLIREKVASGAMSGPVPFGMSFPPARAMYRFTWSEELARLAGRWANQCTVGKDRCRNTANKHNVGQLIFTRKFTPKLEGATKGKDSKAASPIYLIYTNASVLQMTEVMDIEETSNIKAPEFKALAQVLWGTTKKLGCARSVFDYDNKMSNGVPEQSEFLVCNYGSGNEMYGELYAPGHPCSTCECSLNYTSLCESGVGGKRVATFGVSMFPLFLNGLGLLRL